MLTDGREVRQHEATRVPNLEKMDEALDVVGSVIAYHMITIRSRGQSVMEAMELLANRVSSPRLRGQVPRAVIETMVRSAGRAPDHAQLAPYRFLLIEGEARQRLGDIFVEAKEMAGESLDEQARAKLRAKPKRAPHILVGIASLSHHPKVPEQEQIITAGIALQSCLQVAFAMGYGGMWRTGGMAYDRHVANRLGLKENEKIVGYLYVGEVDGALKTAKGADPDEKLIIWE